MSNKKVQKGRKQGGEAVSALGKDPMGVRVQDKQKAVLHDAIAEYAARHGGTAVDIDEELEETIDSSFWKRRNSAGLGQGVHSTGASFLERKIMK
jgi:hypothetical protein